MTPQHSQHASTQLVHPTLHARKWGFPKRARRRASMRSLRYIRPLNKMLASELQSSLAKSVATFWRSAVSQYTLGAAQPAQWALIKQSAYCSTSADVARTSDAAAVAETSSSLAGAAPAAAAASALQRGWLARGITEHPRGAQLTALACRGPAVDGHVVGMMERLRQDACMHHTRMDVAQPHNRAPGFGLRRVPTYAMQRSCLLQLRSARTRSLCERGPRASQSHR